ncbi:MAG: DUF6174 domain-containing protein, partial [Gemmatimonadaceae bacterium]
GHRALPNSLTGRRIPMSLTRQFRTSRFVSALSLAVLALVAAGCDQITGLDGNLGSEQRQLSSARRDWDDVFIRDYEYVVRRDCYCLWSGSAIRVTVRNDFVVAITRESTGEPISLSNSYVFPTIDGIFSHIQSAIDSRAYRVEASYDSQYGFPTDVYIDYDRRAADDEEGLTLLAFRRL